MNGTGVIYDPHGRVLTNAHVVEGAGTVEVALFGGQVLTARVLGRSPGPDLAVLELPAGAYRAAAFGDPWALRAGDELLVLGHPVGFPFASEPSAARGILSKSLRAMDGRYLQTDAPINPGVSGGPVLNSRGEVVGIVEFRYDMLEGRRIQGIGFAIPADQALATAAALEREEDDTSR